ncbi:PTK7 family protein [Megaselia abdita]
MDFLVKLFPVFVILFGSSNGESRFITLPQSQTVIEGDSIVLTCHATPSSGLVYSWTLNGHMVENTSRVHQVGSNLHLKSIIKDIDAGDYVCIATQTSSGARQASPPATIIVIWLKAASVQSISISKKEIQLKCHIEGSPAAEIEWFRNSEKLSSEHNIHIERNHIVIKNPTDFDIGLYRCIVTNNAGRVMSQKGFPLNFNNENEKEDVKACIHRFNTNKKLSDKAKKLLCRGKRGGPLDILIEPTTLGNIYTINETLPVELPCRFDLPEKYKNSVVQLKWRKDGKIFRQIDLGVVGGQSMSESNMESIIREDVRVQINKETGSLIFNQVIASDAGQYHCQIYVNGHLPPTTSDVRELIVTEQLKFAPQPTSKNLELNSVGKVHCKAQGTPTPQVRWIKDDVDVLPDSIEDINGTLTFRNVSSENRGSFTCIANSSQGEISATVFINVVVSPKFSLPPLGPLHALEMGSIHIHCQAVGDPKPTIKWDKDSRYFNENNTDVNRFKFHENGTLEINKVHLDDEGRYGCTIGNSAGLKREEVFLNVKPSETFITEEPQQDGTIITRAVLITMTIALAYIVLVVGLMIWCRYRRQAKKARLAEISKDLEIGSNGKVTNGELDPCLRKKPSKSPAPSKRTNGLVKPKEGVKSDDTTSSKSSKKSNVLDQYSVPRSSLSEIIQIGRGEFGDVFLGKIQMTAAVKNGSPQSSSSSEQKRRSSNDNIEQAKDESVVSAKHQSTSDEYKLVLIKALNKIKDENACQEFKRQIDMFRTVSHKGVAKLLGLCREKDPHYLVLEYTDWGDLKQFLMATAGKVATADGNNQIPPLKMGQILAVAYQIARGMDAIYRARFIHKDLATRNCIVSSDFIVKVSYPGLCKDKYNREYFKHRNSLLPVRWLAPECIQEDEYTTKSDIFAYGVMVWELFTQSTKLPFEELTNEEFIRKHQNYQIDWECAPKTPGDLQEILKSCWRKNPKERPSFSQICVALSKSMQKPSDI